MKNLISYFLLTFLLSCMVCTMHAQVKKLRIILPAKAGTVAVHAREILIRQLTRRCDIKIVENNTADFTIEMGTERMASAESFSITDKGSKKIRIIGSDERGLLYGTGKFLRTSGFGRDGLMPGSWRGTSTPSGKVRGIYFASHFNNFYEAAPIEDVEQYVDELALWGVNYLVVHFPQFQFTGFNDTAAQRSLGRLRQIIAAAKANGMKAGLIQVPNGSFKAAPVALLNVAVPDQMDRRGHFGVNLDPANPEAHTMLMQHWDQLLDEFKTVGLDAVVFWPYDEGGCGCSICWPWGARGFPALCRDLSTTARKRFPGMQVILSTWVFDTPDAGEWKGLTAFLQKDKSWVNYIMADAHEDFPRYPLDKQVPGGVPLLNFPEISMWGQTPWGGYGANPLTSRLQRLWNETGNKLTGGFPYSEGIYEDLNKVICSQFYWNGKRSAQDVVREYISYEFSPAVVDEITRAVEIFELNHQRGHIDSSAEEAYSLVEKAALKLSQQVLQSWRWRIVYLRALIDREIFATKGKLEGETLKRAFNELTSIYHAEHGHSMPIHPPAVE